MLYIQSNQLYTNCSTIKHKFIIAVLKTPMRSQGDKLEIHTYFNLNHITAISVIASISEKKSILLY